MLRAGHGLRRADVPAADLAIPAGEETLAANVAAARRLGVSNTFVVADDGLVDEACERSTGLFR